MKVRLAWPMPRRGSEARPAMLELRVFPANKPSHVWHATRRGVPACPTVATAVQQPALRGAGWAAEPHLPLSLSSSDLPHRTPLPDADVRRQLFGGGLLGRVVGGVLNSALASIAEQARQAQEAAAELQSRAQRVVRGSRELQRAAPGQDFTLLPPVSQSAFTASVNGRVQSRMRLVMPLVDGRGRLLGQAAVEQVSGAGAPEGKPLPLEVEVHLVSGRTIAIKETESTARVIDVEWHEVK